MLKRPKKKGLPVQPKYIKINETESEEEFEKIGHRVFKKELKWSHFKIEDSVGVHYYLILKRKR